MHANRKLFGKTLPSLGSWVAIGNNLSAQIMAEAGYDWLIVDAQHGGATYETAGAMLQATDAARIPAFVRVNWNEPGQIMRALDLGAAGVVVPLVSTTEEARRAAEVMRYPPLGIRSFGPMRKRYAAESDPAAPLCLVQIETAEAIDNLDDIASTPGVDGLLIGPVDLALSLGLGMAFTMGPEVFDAVDKVVAACRRHDKHSGCVALGGANAIALCEHGMEFIALGSDAVLMRRAAVEDVAQFNAWRGEAAPLRPNTY